MTAVTEIEQKVNREDLEAKVKQMYTDVAEHPENEYHFEMGRDLAERLGYNPAILDQIPSGAIDSFAGVGHYFGLAQVQRGEHVVDLAADQAWTSSTQASLQVAREKSLVST